MILQNLYSIIIVCVLLCLLRLHLFVQKYSKMGISFFMLLIIVSMLSLTVNIQDVTTLHSLCLLKAAKSKIKTVK